MLNTETLRINKKKRKYIWNTWDLFSLSYIVENVDKILDKGYNPYSGKGGGGGVRVMAFKK